MRYQLALTTLSLLSAVALASKGVLAREPKLPKRSVRITSIEPPRFYAAPIAPPATGRMLAKRQGTCEIGMFECDLFEGCCPLDTTCFTAGGENGCCPILETCTSVGGCEEGFFQCPETITEGCCREGTTCTVDGCSTGGGDGDDDSGSDGEECAIGQIECSDSEGGGCCSIGFSCSTDGSRTCIPDGGSNDDGDDDGDDSTSSPTFTNTESTSTPTETTSSETETETETGTETETDTDLPSETETETETDTDISTPTRTPTTRTSTRPPVSEQTDDAGRLGAGWGLMAAGVAAVALL